MGSFLMEGKIVRQVDKHVIHVNDQPSLINEVFKGVIHIGVKTGSTLELSPERPEISVRQDFGFSDSEGSAAPLSSLCPGFQNAEITWG